MTHGPGLKRASAGHDQRAKANPSKTADSARPHRPAAGTAPLSVPPARERSKVRSAGLRTRLGGLGAKLLHSVQINCKVHTEKTKACQSQVLHTTTHNIKCRKRATRPVQSLAQPAVPADNFQVLCPGLALLFRVSAQGTETAKVAREGPYELTSGTRFQNGLKSTVGLRQEYQDPVIDPLYYLVSIQGWTAGRGLPRTRGVHGAHLEGDLQLLQLFQGGFIQVLAAWQKA